MLTSALGTDHVHRFKVHRVYPPNRYVVQDTNDEEHTPPQDEEMQDDTPPSTPGLCSTHIPGGLRAVLCPKREAVSVSERGAGVGANDDAVGALVPASMLVLMSTTMP